MVCAAQALVREFACCRCACCCSCTPRSGTALVGGCQCRGGVLQVQGSLESSLMSASTPRYLSNLPLNLPSPVTPLLPVSGKVLLSPSAGPCTACPAAV